MSLHSAAFALPSTGGAVTRAMRTPSRKPVSSLRLARGCRRTSIRAITEQPRKSAYALAPVGGAAGDEQTTLKVTGAYAYVDTIAASRQKFVRVVFETAEDLPGRSDGAIRAGVEIEGVGRSIGSARRGTRIYAGAAEIKGGSIAAMRDGEVVRKRAKIGSTFTVRFFTRDGQSVTRKLKLRAERRGDDTGRPLSS